LIASLYAYQASFPTENLQGLYSELNVNETARCYDDVAVVHERKLSSTRYMAALQETNWFGER